MSADSNSPRALDCGIIGAGIAGLGAAIALRRAGHKVEVFEKSIFKNEIGAAITLTPNGNAVLDKWGFDGKRARETPKKQFRFLDAATLECKSRMCLDGVPELYGHAYNAYHRVDMHEEMRRLAKNHGVLLRIGSEAGDVDCAQGVVTFKDRCTTHKDLIVIADGIKSRFVRDIAGEEVPVRKTGKSVYRTLILMDRLMSDPLVRPLLESEPSGFMSTVKPETGVLFVTHPCREDELMNFAVFHSIKSHQMDAEDWNSPATIEDVLEILDGYHPAWKAIAKHADTMKCYTVGHQDVIPRMVNGKVALIGDAAHPMQPTHAQGGGVSWKEGDSVEQRLQLFNQPRLPRKNVTQIYSNAMFYKYYDEALTEQDPRLREYWSGTLLPLNSQSWDESVREFFYGYDAFAEAQKALQYKDSPCGIPDGAIQHFGLKSCKGPE